LKIVAQQICVNLALTFDGKVGAGTFKETFKAISADASPRALKVFRPGFSPERTAREIDAMKTCDHPNIGKLESVSRCDYQGTAFLFAIEEFIPGGTLSDRLRSRGSLTPDETYNAGCELISAVAHIAERRLVHRDIKPDNILLRADGQTPVLVDFGLVRNLEMESLTQTWAQRGPGTPLFSPPEQLNNEKAYIDWRSDQFSLGVTLSIAGLGLHPYGNVATPIEVIEAVAQRKAPTAIFPAAAGRAGLPVLRKMVAPWPIERFRTPGELISAWRDQRG
jgi:serine/threonine protein kinase